MTKTELELIKLNGLSEEMYPVYVSRLIRERYSVTAELAILRQRDTKPEEFAAYNAYAEECKARAKAELGMEG